MLTELENVSYPYSCIKKERESDGSLILTFLFKSDKWQPSNCNIPTILCYVDGVSFTDLSFEWRKCDTTTYSDEQTEIEEETDTWAITIPAENANESYYFFVLFGILEGQTNKQILSRGIIYL